ncbi:MAG TPA: LysR family transcriptional regulator [Stellaceae bacterium]
MNRLDDMALFVRLVDAGSFTAAAERAGLSKSLLSRRIAALEDRLAARLLNRTTRRLSVTETGAGFYERSKRILTEVEEAETLAGCDDAEPRGTLRVAAPMSFGMRHLSPAFADFLRSHAELSVELDLNDRFVDLASEGHDLAVRVGRLPDSNLVARKLAPSRMAVVASPAYVAAHGKPATPGDLVGRPLLSYSNRSMADEWRFTGLGDRLAGRLTQRMSANNGEVLLDAAVAGLGIAALPTFIASPALARGDLLRLLERHPIEESGIYALYLPNRHLSAKVRRFVDFLAERFGGEPYWDKVLGGG